VNSPKATDTKNGSACESLQSLEIRIAALHWIVLLRNTVTERNLTECEVNSPDGYHAVQFGRCVYITALRYSLTKLNVFECCKIVICTESDFEKFANIKLEDIPSLAKEVD
jgi:hypothetical protein